MRALSRRAAAVASAAVYGVTTAFLARSLLTGLSDAVISDAGDPLLVAAIVYWNGTRLPFIESWWQFPIFAPTRDALAFSEHLLGLAPLTAPLLWATGDAIATYNLILLLTFPLSGVAMYALVHRLTGSAAGSFLAGLAFAFAPYRASHLPHLHLLAAFWTPLALLGLHAYVESGRRRWLALYAAAFALQGASNGYMLVFLSLFVALWGVWFVIVPRNWRALAAVGGATLAALAPFALILPTYASVHASHGFARDIAEIRTYSADLAGVLCAPAPLAFWSWLRTGCRPEGELFPGAATLGLALAAAALCLRAPASARLARLPTLLSQVLLFAAIAFGAAAAAVAGAGPWAFALGPLRVSASSIAKPVMLAVACALLAAACSPRLRAAAKRSSAPGFYAVAALVAWSLTLGPVVVFLGQPRAIPAPFALLLQAPGVEQLRVPARAWLLTTVCLAVLAGYGAAALTARLRRAPASLLVVAAGALVLADGWIGRFPAVDAPAARRDPAPPRGGLVLTLPMTTTADIVAQFRAVTGGWRSVNGYSGYFPHYYAALTDAAREEVEAAVTPFLAAGDLHVVVSGDAPEARTAVERLPGATLVDERNGAARFRIPGRRSPFTPAIGGRRLVVAAARASCARADAGHLIDGDERTAWRCGPPPTGQEVVLDAGRPASLDAVVLNLGRYVTEYPRALRVETSLDGEAWEPSWDGSVRALLVAQAIDDPGRSLRVAVPLGGRVARYVRLAEGGSGAHAWSLVEVELAGRAAPSAGRSTPPAAGR